MIYLLITAFLDLFCSVFISHSYQNISIFFPSIFIGSFPLFYVVLRKERLFFISISVLGILYDLLFSDIFLVNTYCFLLYGLFVNLFFKEHKANYFSILVISIIGTCFYDVFVFFIIILNNYAVFNINELYYKIRNTFLISFFYSSLSIFVLKSRIYSLKKSKKSYI